VRSIVCMTTLMMALALACGGDEAQDAADAASAAGSEVGSAAKEMMDRAAVSAQDAADSATNAAQDAMDAAKNAATTTAASTCRSLAASGSWGQALEACKKAHEMAPDDLELEHAYQQAQAAAGQ